MTVTRVPEGLDDVIADAMMEYGPDRHVDGHEQIAAAAWEWMKGTQLLEALEKLIEETTWITRETSEWANSCAACDAIADDPDNHAPDCALVQARAAIAAARGESG